MVLWYYGLRSMKHNITLIVLSSDALHIVCPSCEKSTLRTVAVCALNSVDSPFLTSPQTSHNKCYYYKDTSQGTRAAAHDWGKTEILYGFCWIITYSTMMLIEIKINQKYQPKGSAPKPCMATTRSVMILSLFKRNNLNFLSNFVFFFGKPFAGVGKKNRHYNPFPTKAIVTSKGGGYRIAVLSWVRKFFQTQFSM